MILVDMNHIVIAGLMAETKGQPVFNPDLIRHMVLNSLRSTNVKHRNTFGKMVLCYDAGNYWRKQIFPHYKASRKKLREDSGFDWAAFYDFFGEFRLELADNFPYRSMYIPTLEADDIIATLAMKTPGPHLIVSSDEDFLQMQQYPGVSQYSLLKKSFLKCSDPKQSLFEKIVYGDTGDGIPNVLSDDDTFITEGKRQKSIMTKKFDTWYGKQPSEFLDQTGIRNFDRNTQLIDLSKMPAEVYDKVIAEWYRTDISRPLGGSVMTYLMKYRMTKLIGDIQDF